MDEKLTERDKEFIAAGFKVEKLDGMTIYSRPLPDDELEMVKMLCKKRRSSG